MKKGSTLLALSVLFGASVANAKTFSCNLIDDNNSGLNRATISLDINSPAEIEFTFRYENGQTTYVTAQRDQNYRGNGVQFIDSATNFGGSDSGKTNMVMSKSLLKGKPGKVFITSDQANESDSGPVYQGGFMVANLFCK